VGAGGHRPLAGALPLCNATKSQIQGGRPTAQPIQMNDDRRIELAATASGLLCGARARSQLLALSRLIRNARASAAIEGKADPDQTTLVNWIFELAV
jgi:hypothetical protein